MNFPDSFSEPTQPLRSLQFSLLSGEGRWQKLRSATATTFRRNATRQACATRLLRKLPGILRNQILRGQLTSTTPREICDCLLQTPCQYCTQTQLNNFNKLQTCC